MKNSLRIHKWTHNEFNIFILGVLTHPRRHYAVIAKIFGKNPVGGIVEGRKATLFPLYLPLFPSVKFRQ